MRKSKGCFIVLACALAVWLARADAYAQQVSVRGRVVDAASNAPVAGASVVVEGTSIGTLTSGDGEFLLQVPDLNATLAVSLIGYRTERVALAGRNVVLIPLTQEAVALDEVVVVGYGTQRRRDITGAVAGIGSAELESTTSLTVEQALQGRVPGAMVTQSSAGAEPNASFLVRGRNSITGGNSPLIVVDGIPYQGAISELNLADMESATILKDASSAAIYGSRAANGVLLITTRRGSGQPRISYRGSIGVHEIANLPRLMNGAEFAEFKCQHLNGGVDCDEVLTATERENLAAGRSTDWVGLAMRTGYEQEHAFTISGGSEDTRYYISASILDVAGMAKNDDFERYSVRLNLDQQLKPWIRTGTSTQLALTDRGGLPVSFGDAFFMNPLTNAFNEDGTLTITPWPEDNFWGNPLGALLVKDDDVTRRIFSSNYVEVSAPFLEGLSFRVNAGFDFAYGKSGRYWGRNTRTGQNALGRSDTRNSTRFDWTVENIARFTRSFGQHNLDLTGLFSVQRNTLESQGVTAETFPTDVLTYYRADLAAISIPSYSVSRSWLVSQMGRLNYSFADRYLLTLTARRDGYSGFGENHKYGVFPSMAVAWNISNESFWPLKETVNSLKLRASWGENGNQAIGPYETLSRLSSEPYLDGNLTAPGFLPSSLGNPELRWEATTTVNLGVDFVLFGQRVDGSLDVYRKRTHDLLLDRLISPVHGTSRITENIGKTENRGIELALTTRNIDKPDFGWETTFNISANRNKILDLYGDGKDDVVNGWFIGHPITVNYAYKFDGIWQTDDDIANSAQPTAKPGDVRILDVNGDKQITPDDRTFIGNREPSYIAGLTNTLRYKGFTLTAFLYTVQGVTRANSLLSTNVVQSEVRRNTIYREYWTPENPINTAPANRADSNPLNVSFYEDASFIRLKDVTLSYQVPRSVVQRLGISDLRLSLSGRNLWTHTKWTGLDPELGDQRNIPLARVFMGGINVSF